MAAIHMPCLGCRAGTSIEEDAAAAACGSCGAALPLPGAAAWLVARSGSQFGPYTIVQLISYVAERRVLATDVVWHHGAADWVVVGEVPALTAGPAPASAPAPAPAQPESVSVAKSPAAEPAPAPAPAQPEPVSVAKAPTAVSEPIPAPAPVPAPAPDTVWTPPSAAPGSNRFGLHVKRAFNWDLRSLPVEPDEEEKLIASGVDEPDARRYLVWRRSVLLVVAIPTLISALLAAIGTATTDMSSLSGVGILLEIVRVAALLSLPVTAWLAARAWAEHRRSRAILVRGWLFAFLTPLLLALIPYSWRIDLSAAGGDLNVINMVNAAVSYAGAVSVYLTLMPSVLSLIPGVLRGCLRIKALIPESILPGLFLVAATPLYILLFLVIFTTVNQAIGDFMLMIGILALLAAPMLYLFNARTFTRPLRSDAEIAKVGSVQKTVLAVIGIGLVLLLISAFTASIWVPSSGGNFRQVLLLGFDSDSSLMQPWQPSVLQFPIEYLVRSLFTTVLVADLFMLMNLQLWRDTREFQASPEAASYDRLMIEIEEAGGAPQPAAQNS